MAYVNNSTRVEGLGGFEGFSGLVKSVKLAIERRAVFHRTLRELNSLTDRDLADLGISRSQIRALAQEAAYGN